MAADVDATLTQWSTTAASNKPAGSTSISNNLDDNLREIQKVVRQQWASTSIASAATTDLASVNERFVTVTGTTTITALGTLSAGIERVLVFAGVLTLTHNGTSLILPGGGNITTAAGDVAFMLSLGSGNWRCTSYMKASGNPVTLVSQFADGTVSAPGATFASDTDTGFYRIGANTIGVTTGGAKAMEIAGTSVEVVGELAAAGGYFADASVGDATDALMVTHTAARNGFSFRASSNNTSATDGIVHVLTTGGSGNLIAAATGSGNVFKVSVSGQVSSDAGTTITTPADYAEMFEWADGNPDGEDRVGMSVVLVGNKIRVAQTGERPFGVVSGDPAVLADSGEGAWAHKYARDEFNRPQKDADGRYILSPDFDPDRKYVPRSQRKEWSPVGLVGKLRIRDGQVISPAWRFMRRISDSVSEYLVGVV